MKKPLNKIWSFEYQHNGARYSLDIEAESRAEAQARLRAAQDASIVASIMPDDSTNPIVSA